MRRTGRSMLYVGRKGVAAKRGSAIVETARAVMVSWTVGDCEASLSTSYSRLDSVLEFIRLLAGTLPLCLEILRLLPL